MLPRWLRRPLLDRDPDPLPPASLPAREDSLSISYDFKVAQARAELRRLYEDLAVVQIRQHVGDRVEVPERLRHYDDVDPIEMLTHAELMRLGRDAGLDPHRDRARILMSSSVAGVVSDVIGKTLAERRRPVNPAWRRACGPFSVLDYKPTEIVHPVELPAFTPGRTYVHGAAVVSLGEPVQAVKETLGTRLPLEDLLADSVGALAAMVQAIDAQADARRTKAVVDLLVANPNMRDGTPFLDASRGNVAGSGAALDATTLGVAIAAMRNQASPNGMTGIVEPRLLVVAPAAEVAARQLAASMSSAEPVLEVLALPGIGSAWFLLADPLTTPAIGIASVRGRDVPVIHVRESWETDALEIGAAISFKVFALEPRAIFKNPGA